MKGLLLVFVLLAAAVVGLGFYLGWFHVSTGGADGQRSATVTVDQDKFNADKDAAKEKVKDLGEKAKEKANGTTDKGDEKARRP